MLRPSAPKITFVARPPPPPHNSMKKGGATAQVFHPRYKRVFLFVLRSRTFLSVVFCILVGFGFIITGNRRPRPRPRNELPPPGDDPDRRLFSSACDMKNSSLPAATLLRHVTVENDCSMPTALAFTPAVLRLPAAQHRLFCYLLVATAQPLPSAGKLDIKDPSPPNENRKARAR
jgi:hypothetical protein